jgi:hypothetical protein
MQTPTPIATMLERLLVLFTVVLAMGTHDQEFPGFGQKEGELARLSDQASKVRRPQVFIREWEYGFLGNIMFMYASAFGISRRNGALFRFKEPFCLRHYTNQKLEDIFPALADGVMVRVHKLSVKHSFAHTMYLLPRQSVLGMRQRD